MDILPLEYIAHLKPIMAVIGLNADGNSGKPLNQLFSSTFLLLISNVIEQMSSLHIWDESVMKDGTGFRIIKIEQDHSLLKQKNVLTVQSGQSELSPLNPDSTLYPNIIMSPKWVDKHLTSVPSIVLHVYILSEKHGDSFLDKDRDQFLCQEINEKKKYFSDKNIKLAVALLTFQDIPVEEERINFIRKNCGLDTKSLFPFFLNTNTSEADISSFLINVQRTLMESSINYYKEKTKKIMKKRRTRQSLLSSNTTTRNSPAQQTNFGGILPPPPTLGGHNLSSPSSPSTKRPLNSQCWEIRYSYKLGVFSEFRQDLISALKYYEEAYNGLANFFKTQIDKNSSEEMKVVSPFTASWAEMQMLMDSISFRISKLHMYVQEYSSALKQLTRHLQQSFALSDAIAQHPVYKVFYGTSTWEWVSVQYRLFAEVVEAAAFRGNGSIPFGKLKTDILEIPRLSSEVNKSASSRFTLHQGTNPGLVIQAPGFYYHMAAKCYEMQHQNIEGQLNPEQFRESAMKVVEMLTKAYEQNKSFKYARHSLFLASEIARVYKSTDDYQMALRFFERIAKSYRKDSWFLILGEVLLMCAECSLQSGSLDILFSSMTELLHKRFRSFQDRFNTIMSQAKQKILNTVSSDTPLHILIDTDHVVSPIEFRIRTKLSTIHLGSAIPFQLHISVPDLRISHGLDIWSRKPGLVFTRIKIEFSDPTYDITFVHDKAATSQIHRQGKYGFYNMSILENIDSLDLTFNASEQEKVISFQVKPIKSQDLVVRRIEAVLSSDALGPVTIALEYKIGEKSKTDLTGLQKWLDLKDGKVEFQPLDTSSESNSIRVLNPSLDLKISFEPPNVLLLDDLFPLRIELSTKESLLYYMMDVHIEDDEKIPYQTEFWHSSVTTGSMELLGSKAELSLYKLSRDQASESINYYLKRISGEGEVKLVITVHYSSTSFDRSMVLTSPQIQRKIEMFKFNVAKPFDIQIGGYLMPNETEVGQSLFCHVDLTWCGKQSIVAEDIRLVSPKTLSTSSSSSTEYLYNQQQPISFLGKPDSGRIWKCKDNISLTVQSKMNRNGVQKFDLGVLEIDWKSVDSSLVCHSRLEIPVLEFMKEIVEVRINAPEHAYFGKPFTTEYTIRNTTKEIQELAIYVESSEHFVFSGMKSCLIKLLPLQEENIYFNNYPVGCGKCILPKVRISRRREFGSNENIKDIECFKISGLDASELSIFVYPVVAELLV